LNVVLDRLMNGADAGQRSRAASAGWGFGR
jgi:hypothetical protein